MVSKENNRKNVDENINYYSEVEPAIFEFMIMRETNKLSFQDIEELKEIMDDVKKSKGYRVKKRDIQEIEKQKA